MKVEKESKPKQLRREYTSLFVAFEMSYTLVAYFQELLKLLEKDFSEDLPLELHMDKLVIRVMDEARIKIADLVFPKHVFEEWLVSNATKERISELPIRVKVPIKEVNYAIGDAGKDARIRFEANLVFVTTKPMIEVQVRKPEVCPKCYLATNWNRLPPEKRKEKLFKNGRGKRESYKCQCGWRGKVSTYKKKQRMADTTICADRSTFLITVKEKTTDKFNIKTIEFADEELPMPKIAFNCAFKVMAKEFYKKIEKLSKHKDIECARFVGSNDGLVIKGIADITDVSIKIDRASDILLDARCVEKQESRYNLSHLLAIMPKKLVDVLKIEYSTDMPLRLTWFTSVTDTIQFCLAPRIDVDV